MDDLDSAHCTKAAYVRDQTHTDSAGRTNLVKEKAADKLYRVDEILTEAAMADIHRVASEPSLRSDGCSRQHHSAPTSYSSASATSTVEHGCPVTRSRFEKRQKFSHSKQESMDLPDDLYTCPEDNVFTDSRSDQCNGEHRVKSWCQRSISVPATLPDVVQEASTSPGDGSPDVLLKGEAELNFEQSEAKLAMGRNHAGEEPVAEHSASAEFAVSEWQENSTSSLEDQFVKLQFEGTTCYPPSQKHSMRRKSVSFDVATDVSISERGKKARSHFRSSGYGSQSESSQKSGNTSNEESVMSDDVLASLERSFETGFGGSTERSSLETGFDGSTDKCACSMDQESSHTHVDGNVEGSDSGTPKQSRSVSDSSENSHTLSGNSPLRFEIEGGASCQGNGAGRPGSPPGATAFADNMPCLSIFETLLPSVKETGDGSVHCSGVAGDDLSFHRQRVLQRANNAGAEAMFHDFPQLPFQPAGPSNNRVGPFTAPKGGPESHTDKFSPTSFQQDLLSKAFFDRMEKFDPSEESISDLLNWFKNNWEDALSPSPQSPFFPADGSPQSFMLSPIIAARLGLPAADVGRLIAFTTDAENRHPPTSTCQGDAPTTQTSGASGSSASSNAKRSSGELMMRGTVSSTMQPRQTLSQLLLSQPGTTTYIQQAVPTVVALAENPNREMMSTSDSSIALSNTSFGTGVSDSYLEQVPTLAQCTDIRCLCCNCLQWKGRVQSLKEAIRRGESLSDDNNCLVKVLCRHYSECDHPSCPVPWCRFICRSAYGRGISPPAVVLALSNPMHTLLPADFHATTFLWLSSEWPFVSMPKELEHWLLLCHLSQTQIVVRAVPLVTTWPNKHWAVKLTTLHEGRNQLEVLQSLQDLQHPYIIPHLWAAADEGNDLLLVCTEYQPGISLKELLNLRFRLDTSQTSRYLLQILSALKKLHDLQIVYLNWDSSNFLLDPNCQRVKMTNFTSCVQLPGENADMGNIKLSLPVDVVPPEFLVSGGELKLNTDSWGVACILHEMLTGGRPWSYLRHKRQEDIWRQIKRQARPDLSDIPPFMRDLLIKCFKRCPAERLSVADLAENIQRNCQTLHF